jgi:Uma2 family endonuclease
MSLHEIVLGDTKPYPEWVRGRVVFKQGGTYVHASAQAQFGRSLGEWARREHRGRVAIEWRFRVAPPGEIVRPLIPDVAYLSYAQMPADAPSERFQTPLGAPTVAVEILEEDDDPADVEHKIGVYRAAGAAAVIVVDPRAETVTVHDERVRAYRPGELLTHESLPGFALPVEELFER